MIPIDEAIDCVLEFANVLGTVDVDLNQSVGRVLAEDAVADFDQPPFSKSLVDGFALGIDCEVASDKRQFSVIDKVAAGETSTQSVEEQNAIQIMTGAPIPKGTTAVVMLEDVTEPTSGSIELETQSIRRGQCILEQGSVCRAGEVVVRKGSRLTPARVGVLAEAGYAVPKIFKDPVLSILTTGNEIVPVESKPDHRCIRNSNGPMLSAAGTLITSECHYLGHVADESQALADSIESGLSGDILVLTGGVSMGQLDLVPEVLESLGVQKKFHKVNLKPGKPVWFGVYENSGERCLVFGLPGNPVSVFVCFELFVKPAIRKMQGLSNMQMESSMAKLNDTFTNRGNRFLLQPGILDGESNGVEILKWIGSADQIRLAEANCLVEFPAHSQIEAGQQVRVRRLV